MDSDPVLIDSGAHVFPWCDWGREASPGGLKMETGLRDTVFQVAPRPGSGDGGEMHPKFSQSSLAGAVPRAFNRLEKVQPFFW